MTWKIARSLWAASLRGIFAAVTLAALGGCATLSERGSATDSHALPADVTGPLGQLVTHSKPAGLPPGYSGFRLLHDGPHALDARIALANTARRSLDVQYYILSPDISGTLFLQALRNAAERGVRVRLLVDDLYTGDSDSLLLDQHKQPNFEVRLFNPLPARGGTVASRVVRSLHEFKRINHRMHNKLLIADGAISVSGGRNVSDQYFMRAADANFIDMDVIAAGAVIQAQAQIFDEYWNSRFSYPVSTVARSDPASEAAGGHSPASWWRNLDVTPASADVFHAYSLSHEIVDGRMNLTWAPAQVLADSPEKARGTDSEHPSVLMITKLLQVFTGAESDVFISTPYFVPGQAGLDAIQRIRKKDVKVTLVTNSLASTDEPLVHARYIGYRAAMLDLGVQVYEMSPSLISKFETLGKFKKSIGRLHSKLAIVDRRWFYIGSMNFDRRSANLNTEAGLLIDSAPLVAQFHSLLEVDRFRSAHNVKRDPDGTIRWTKAAADGGITSTPDEPNASAGSTALNFLLSMFIDEELL